MPFEICVLQYQSKAINESFFVVAEVSLDLLFNLLVYRYPKILKDVRVALENLALNRCDICPFAAMPHEIKDRKQKYLSKLKSYEVIPNGQRREEAVKLEAKQKGGWSWFRKIAKGSRTTTRAQNLDFPVSSEKQYPHPQCLHQRDSGFLFSDRQSKIRI